MENPANAPATKEDIHLLLDRLEGYHRLTDKRIGLTQVRIVESEERIKRHLDLVTR